MAEIALEWHVGLRAKRLGRWGREEGKRERGREKGREREREKKGREREKERERGRNEMQNVSIYTTLLLSLACLPPLPLWVRSWPSPYPARLSRIHMVPSHP